MRQIHTHIPHSGMNGAKNYAERKDTEERNLGEGESEISSGKRKEPKTYKIALTILFINYSYSVKYHVPY